MFGLSVTHRNAETLEGGDYTKLEVSEYRLKVKFQPRLFSRSSDMLVNIFLCFKPILIV